MPDLLLPKKTTALTTRWSFCVHNPLIYKYNFDVLYDILSNGSEVEGYGRDTGGIREYDLLPPYFLLSAAHFAKGELYLIAIR